MGQFHARSPDGRRQAVPVCDQLTDCLILPAIFRPALWLQVIITIGVESCGNWDAGAVPASQFCYPQPPVRDLGITASWAIEPATSRNGSSPPLRPVPGNLRFRRHNPGGPPARIPECPFVPLHPEGGDDQQVPNLQEVHPSSRPPSASRHARRAGARRAVPPDRVRFLPRLSRMRRRKDSAGLSSNR